MDALLIAILMNSELSLAFSLNVYLIQSGKGRNKQKFPPAEQFSCYTVCVCLSDQNN